MGSTQSKSSDAKERNGEEKHKRELAERGVLLPPLFVIGSCSTHTPPTYVYSESEYEYAYKYPYPYQSPSLLARLRQESLSHSILTHYLNPGICITSHTNSSANANGSVSASLIPTVTSTGTCTGESVPDSDALHTSNSLGRSTGNPNAVLRISQCFQNKLQFDLFYASHCQQSLAAALLVTPSLKLSSRLDAHGAGWLGCQYRTSVANVFQSLSPNKESIAQPDRLHLHFGTWLDLNSNKGPFLSMGDSRRLTTETAARPNFSSAHAYASLQVPGCLLAIQGKLPITYEQFPELSYYASVDLTTEGPPLTATLTKTPHTSSLGFSQTLQWDRWVLNPVEVTCPKIRNTLCWTVELETTDNHGSGGGGATNDKKTSSVPKAGLVWQVNRGLAFKVVAQPRLSGAIILKRWKQPQIVCSVLFGQGDKQSGRAVEFQGIGVHLEIGDSFASFSTTTAAEEDLYQQPSSKPTIVSPRVPPTKATLPDD